MEEEEPTVEKMVEDVEKTRKQQEQMETIVMPKATYLFKELPFFKIEPIILGAVTFFGLLLVALNFLGLADYILSIAAFVLIVLVAWGFWLIKLIFYMPYKDRHPGLRIFSSGMAMITCEKLKKGKIEYGKELQPVSVTNLRASTDPYTGHPFIISYEGYHENLNVPQIVGGDIHKQTAEHVGILIDEGKEQGKREERLKYYSIKHNIFGNPLFWMMAIVIVMILVSTLAVQLPISEKLDSTKESLDSLNATMKAINEKLPTVGAQGNVEVLQGSG